jgi:hypothetical protein
VTVRDCSITREALKNACLYREARSNAMYRFAVVAAVLLASTILSFGQNNCPQGFNHVGTLYGTGSYGEPFNQVVEMSLPMNATVDRSFKQTGFKATNGKSGATSNLTGKNIPAGVYVVAYGSEDNDKGWSVNEPQLRIVRRSDGTIEYLFGARLFCNVTIGESDVYGTCDVAVDLCYKPKP